MISAGIANNGVNGSLGRISGEGKSSPQPLKSAGMLEKLGGQISALFTAILPRIGETGLPSPFQGNPSAPAGGSQTANAPEKATEAGSGTTVTVGDDPRRKKLVDILRDEDFDVGIEEIPAQAAKDWAAGKISLKVLMKKITAARKAEEKKAEAGEGEKATAAEGSGNSFGSDLQLSLRTTPALSLRST